MFEKLLPLLRQIKQLQTTSPCDYGEISSIWRQISDLMPELPIEDVDIMMELGHDLAHNCSDDSYAAWCIGLPGMLQRATPAQFQIILESLPNLLHNQPVEWLELDPSKTKLLKESQIHTVGQLINRVGLHELLPKDAVDAISAGLSKLGISERIH